MHRVYHRLVLAATVLYIFEQLTYAYQARNDMERLSRVLFLMLCHLTCIAKQFVFHSDADKINQLVVGLDDALCNQPVETHRLLLLETSRRAARLLMLYSGCAVSTCILWAVFPLLDQLRGRTVEFAFWIPIDYRHNAFQFAVVLAYAFYSTSLVAVANTTMDAFIATVLYQCTTQLRILRMNFESLPERAYALSRKTRQDYHTVTHELLVDCLLHYKKITETCNLLEQPTSMMPLRQDRTEDKRKKNPAIAPSKIVTYDDLPYMGEMTLNNSKPRRGRKPKKADICHLIYENYGTVVPGQPSPREGLNLVPSPFREPINPKTDLQNKIISNLMERKLSQENKRRMENASPSQYSTPALIGHDEPLNLCIRDLRDLKIQIQKKFGNIYTSLLDVKSDDADTSDPESCKSEQPNAISVIQRNTSICPPTPSPLQDADTKLVLKQITDLLDPKLIDRLEDAKKSPEAKMKRASPNPIQGPVKRKRSAIFIPPVPTKSNSTTPTTEVSICKFKFTGGSKPSLQEKKMLSVDSGGNFRYYSGGNKGNKGYEYLQNNQARSQQTGELSVDTKPKEGFKEEESKKKRKSRKSLQREKLEQTFKEKGFLIQTQQLQSAEGATYCKFRQLRKFTRYLFRSWKDYLPGELEEKPTENNEVRDTAGDWS